MHHVGGVVTTGCGAESLLRDGRVQTLGPFYPSWPSRRHRRGLLLCRATLRLVAVLLRLTQSRKGPSFGKDGPSSTQLA